MAGINAMTNRTALHENDRMMAVLPCDGGRQSEDEFGFGFPGHGLEANGRQVMTFIDFS